MLTQTSRWSCPVVRNPAESGCMRLGVYTWAAGTGRECIAVSVDREARPPCCPQLCSPRPALWSAGERLLGRAESAGAQAPVTSVDVLLGDGKGSRLPARLPLLCCPGRSPPASPLRGFPCVPPMRCGEGDRQGTVPPPDRKLSSQGAPCGCCQVSLGQVVESGQTSVSLRGWLSPSPPPPHPTPWPFRGLRGASVPPTPGPGHCHCSSVWWHPSTLVPSFCAQP